MNHWDKFFESIKIQDKWIELKKFVAKERENKNIFPAPSEVLNSIRSPEYDDVRLVIVGTEPYSIRNKAHGFAYSSLEPMTNSLEKLYREINSGLGTYHFETNNLTVWTKQGVMLHNIIGTVEEEKPHSHFNKGWEWYSSLVLNELNKHPLPVAFIFLGSVPKQFAEIITNPKHLVLTSVIGAFQIVEEWMAKTNRSRLNESYARKDYDYFECTDRALVPRILCERYGNMHFMTDILFERMVKQIVFGYDMFDQRKFEVYIPINFSTTRRIDCGYKEGYGWVLCTHNEN